jgi:DNA-binding response OmpR family regulator
VPWYCRAALLPVLTLTDGDSIARYTAAAVGGGIGKTVLVVDDDPSLRMLCRINLELDGFRVVEASSVGQARQQLAAEPVDAMLLDLHLGDGDGRDLLRELGTERPPVALFTGSEAIGDELRSVADAVLSKPFELDVLSSTVAGLVQVDSSR